MDVYCFITNDFLDKVLKPSQILKSVATEGSRDQDHSSLLPSARIPIKLSQATLPAGDENL